MDIKPWVVAGTAAACYFSSLHCGLVFDDIAAVRDNRDLRPHTPIRNLFMDDFWGTPLTKEQSHKSYRPLCVLSYRLNYSVHNLDPYGYHLVNVILHAVVCLLYYRVCMLYLPIMASFVAAMLFAVHPIHSEAVAGVVGRAELLSAVFYLSALYIYTSRRNHTKPDAFLKTILSVSSLATLGMLCKEQCVTALALCAISESIGLRAPDIKSLIQGKLHLWLRKKVRRIWLLICAAGVILYIRIRIMGPHFPVFNRFDNPASVSSSPSRQLTYNHLLAVNAWLLLFPSALCCDWTMGTIPLIAQWTDTRNLVTVVFYVTVAVVVGVTWSCKDSQHRKAVLMSIAMVAVPFIPTSNILFPVGFVVAERVLYLPSMGFCMLVAYGWHMLWKKSCFRKVTGVLLAFLLVIHGLKTHLRNYDWESELSLYSSALRVNQRNAKLFNNMGLALENLDRRNDALNYFKEAIRVQPDCLRGYVNLGRVLTNLRRFTEAEDVYLRAKSILPPPENMVKDTHVTPSYLQVYLNLATLIARNKSRLEEADMLYQQAIKLRSDYSDAYLNRGDVLLKLNRTKEAEQMYEAAINLDNNNPNLYYNLGVVLMDQGRNDEALKHFSRALDIDPDHEKAIMNSAVLIQDSGTLSQKQSVTDRLQRVVEQGKENEQLYYNLGMLALRNKNYTSAENCLKRALQIKPAFKSALFNIALLLSDQHRPFEALPFLVKLLQHYPNHIKGLVLLGDIYVNHIRDLDQAEKCYKTILRLDPRHQQGLHNLCVVHVERGDLLEAEKCFVEATKLHPDVDYIQKHLEVTRSLLTQRLPRDHLTNFQLQPEKKPLLHQLSSS